MIPALLLTAGLATRLRPLSLVRAKASLPVAGEPIVRRILRHLAQASVPGAVLNLHHLPATITREVGDGSDLRIPVQYSWENPVLGSAGGPKRAVPLMRAMRQASGSAFLIVNGDTLTNVDLMSLASAHQESGALVTLAVVPNTQPDKYGGVVAGRDNIVTGFSTRGSREPSYHFIGVQAADPRAFAGVPDGVPWESVGALYPQLMKERPGAIRVYPCAAEFYDIGTVADYFETSLLFASSGNGHLRPGSGCRVAASAIVDRSIVWNEVVIEEDVTLRECIIADGTRVPAGSSWTRLTLRAAVDPLAPGEERIGDLAVSRF